MTKEELMAKIAKIKNANQKGENTAMRVGSAMEDMVNLLEADNEDVLKIYVDLSWVIEGVYNNTFPTPTEDDPYVLSASEIEQTFGMSKELLINKILNAKHNIAFVSGTCEIPNSGVTAVLKLNTISAFKGMVANGGSMAMLSCPITIDMLEGAHGVIRIQSTSPNTMEVVFILLEEEEEDRTPATYKIINWDGEDSFAVNDGDIVRISRTNQNNLFYFDRISGLHGAMIFATFTIDSMTFTSVTFTSPHYSKRITDLETGTYQISCIFGNVTIQKTYD